jgi:microcystin-dependent protein
MRTAPNFNNLVFANINENLKVEVDGTIIYDDIFNTVPYAKAAENGVPPGCIMPYAGSVNSSGNLLEPIPGWLVCNGATLPDEQKYNSLKIVLGTAWGTNVLPDLRGVFLRGINDGRTGIYADPETRTVGKFQTDTLGTHNHSGSTSQSGEHTHKTKVGIDNNYTGTGESLDNLSGPVRNTDYEYTSSLNGLHSHIIPTDGGAETRPVNAAVVYIIKY